MPARFSSLRLVRRAGKDPRFAGRIADLACGLAILLTSACASSPVVVPTDANSFSGLVSFVPSEPPLSGDVASAGKPLRILLIHGMGTATKDDFDGFIASVAAKLQLTQIPSSCLETRSKPCPEISSSPAVTAPISRPIDIPGVPEADRAILYTYAFASGPAGSVGAAAPAMTVSFLLWSPLTSTIKCRSLDESTCPNSNDAGAPPRQWFATAAKDFIDDKLADVVLYLGKYGKRVLRPTVESALCYLVDGRPTNGGRSCSTDNESVSANQPATVIITHSLGAYMLIDAIHDELTRDARAGGRNEHTAAAKVVASTQLIYMMANQLALLDLAASRTSFYPSIAGEAHRHGGAPATTALKDFISDWSHFKPKSRWRMRANEEPGPLEQTVENSQIVAFSDSNDVLSWLVKTENLELPSSNAGAVSLTNVYMSNNEFEIPPVFSDPVQAHVGYFNNQMVLDLLVCGMSKGAVGGCAKPAPR